MNYYSATFKCRLCGEIFTTSVAGGWRAAERAAIYASMGKVTEEQAPALHDIHICENGGIGIADFLGFKERKDERSDPDPERDIPGAWKHINDRFNRVD